MESRAVDHADPEEAAAVVWHMHSHRAGHSKELRPVNHIVCRSARQFTVSRNARGLAPGTRSRSPEGLVEVGDQVVLVLKADREAQKVGRGL
jgi:hypothetical protein